MDKWIKCKDRMPNEYMDVWFSAKSHPNCPFVGHFVNKTFYARESCPFGNVTHWMPFERPLPPEPEDSELVKSLERKFGGRVMSVGNVELLNDFVQAVKDFERNHSK